MEKFDHARQGDYILSCAICGLPCWFSESHKLSVYTGRGGLYVCTPCNDPVDYGLIPYKIPAEKNVPYSQDDTNQVNPQNIPVEFALGYNAAVFDPLGTTPQYYKTATESWDQLGSLTWDKWNVPWGTGN